VSITIPSGETTGQPLQRRSVGIRIGVLHDKIGHQPVSLGRWHRRVQNAAAHACSSLNRTPTRS
jgi:hypothetical protein